MLKSIDVNTIHYHFRFLSGISVRYGAASVLITSVYENFGEDLFQLELSVHASIEDVL